MMARYHDSNHSDYSLPTATSNLAERAVFNRVPTPNPGLAPGVSTAISSLLKYNSARSSVSLPFTQETRKSSSLAICAVALSSEA